MRLLLNAHSAFASPLETKFFGVIYERFHKQGPWEKAVETFLGMCDKKLVPPIDLTDVRAELLSLPSPDYARLLEMPLSRWAAHEGKRRWAEKTPEHLFYSEAIARLFPQAKFIEMIRDPRAVVASIRRVGLKGSDLTRQAFYWRYFATSGHNALCRAVGPERRLQVRYEALVTEPEATASAICAFVGEEFEPSMLEYHTSTDHYHRNVRREWDPRLYQAINADLDSWRGKLAPEEIDVIETVCGAQMDALGYGRRRTRRAARSTRTKIAVTQAYVAWKHWQQRGRTLHSITAPVLGRFRSNSSHSTVGFTLTEDSSGT
jgi:hypothetical protein